MTEKVIIVQEREEPKAVYLAAFAAIRLMASGFGTLWFLLVMWIDILDFG